MSDLEPAEVLDQVKHQVAPASWKVFRAQAGYFGENISVYLLLAFMLAFVVAGSTFAVLSVPSPGSDLLPLLPAAAALCALSIGLVWMAIRQIRRLHTVNEQVLVVTSEGFIACVGEKPQDTATVAYADLDAISLQVLPTRYEAVFLLQLVYNESFHPRRYEWRIPPQFRSLDAIAQTIIETHMYYKMEHTKQDRRWEPVYHHLSGRSLSTR